MISRKIGMMEFDSDRLGDLDGFQCVRSKSAVVLHTVHTFSKGRIPLNHKDFIIEYAFK